MSKVVFTDRGVKDYRKLPQDIKARITSKIIEYSENPLNHARKLSHHSIGAYRFRIGNYRIIFDFEEDNIIILRVGHRKDIYQ